MIAVGCSSLTHRRDDLDLEPLIALALGQQLAAATEERVCGHVGRACRVRAHRRAAATRASHSSRQATTVSASPARTCSCMRNICIRVGVVGRLVPEAVRHDVDQTARRGQRAGEHGIHRIARRGREHDVGGRKRCAPVAPRLQRRAAARGAPLRAGEAVNGAGQVRKRREVAALFEVRPVEDRRKAHDLWPIAGADRGDQAIDTLERVLELALRPYTPGTPVAIRRPWRSSVVTERSRRDADGRCVRRPSHSSLCTSSIAALAARTRSLLIMSAAPCASRRWRPTAYGESLR